MNSFARKWNRLIALARQAESGAADTMPPAGFVTRLAALALVGRGERAVSSVWAWLAVRGLGVACVITVLAIAAAWPVMSDASQDDLAKLSDPLLVAYASP